VGVVFFVIAGLYILSVIATSLIHYVGEPHERESQSMLADVVEGFQYMRDEKLILGLMIMGFVPMTFGFSASFLLPAFNKDIIGGGPDDLGLMMTGMGIGALCGSLLLARFGDIGGKGRIMFVTSYFWAVALGVFAFSTNLSMAMIVGAVSGLFGSIFGALNWSIVQLAIRDEIRGRVMAIMMMSHGLMPLGIIPVSAIAEFVGIDMALIFSACMLALSMILLGRWFPELKQIDKGYGPDTYAEDESEPVRRQA
jgi:predicted MFS family arabinose efflux permease